MKKSSKLNRTNKLQNKRLKVVKILSLATALFLSTTAFGQSNTEKEADAENRVEFNYKQRHSALVTKNQNLFADGIKIKRDLKILKDIQEQRILDADEIPAEDLYGGIWIHNRVAAYNDVMKDAPDTFKVDLTNFTMPTTGHVTSLFGMRRRRMHFGMDLKVQVGDTIYAAFDGKVRVRQYEGKGYGYYLVLRHPNGLETVYGHLSGFLVDLNDVVKSGQPIGLGGNTGRSFGSHLHFEFRYLGKNIDPRDIVDFDNKVCHKDEFLITPETFNYQGSKWRTNTYASTRTGTNVKNKFASGNTGYHRIKSGDTLSSIAKLYGTTVNALCRLNNITSKTVLHTGRSIRVN